MALTPLHQKWPVKRVVVSTYQAASGAGAAAMRELEVQAGELLAGKPPTKEIFPHQVAFNLFSHNTAINETGYNEEELKMVKETRKILHEPDSCCHRHLYPRARTSGAQLRASILSLSVSGLRWTKPAPPLPRFRA